MNVLAVGTELAGYRVDAFVGRGGMGVVYRARELGLGRTVALKVVAPELIEDDAVRERFLHEARAAAAIEHPHVIPVHAAGEENGVAFLAMRFIDGSDLRARVRRAGALPFDAAVDVIEQAASGLDAIHRAGFVHRDVKPANLLLDPAGHVYVTDFGLAKEIFTHGGASSTGHWVGTLDYVSPEQIRGGRIDARADVYALGAALHYALTARVPFERDGDEAKLWAQLSEPPPKPSRWRPEIPPAVDAVVGRAMAKAPVDRYPSAGDLARAARAALSGRVPSQPERMVARGAAAPEGAPSEPGFARDASTATSRRKPRRRVRPVVVAAAAALALGGAGVVAAVALRPGNDPPGSDDAVRTAPPRRAWKAVRRIDDVVDRPNGIVYAGGHLWVTGSDSARLARIDPASGRIVSRAAMLGNNPVSMVRRGNTIWVALNRDRQIVGVSAHTGKVVHRIRLSVTPLRLAVGASGLWAVTRSPARRYAIARYDAAGRAVGAPFPLAHSASGVAVVGARVVFADLSRPALITLDPRTGNTSVLTNLPGAPDVLTFSGDYLWATLRSEDVVARVDPRRGDPSTLSAGHRPQQVVVVGQRLFIASRDEQQVLAYGVKQFEPRARIDVGLNPFALTTDGRSVWVTSVGDDSVTQIAVR